MLGLFWCLFFFSLFVSDLSFSVFFLILVVWFMCFRGWRGFILFLFGKWRVIMIFLVGLIYSLGIICLLGIEWLLKLVCYTSFLFFTCKSLLFLYFSFEFCLLPVILIIFLWGTQPERLGAIYYLFLYALTSSLPFLIVLGLLKDSLNYVFLCGTRGLLFWGLVLGFIVKTPLYGFHLWLPKAHVEAPSLGSVVLAGLLLKLGTFGLCLLLFLSFNFYFWGFEWLAILGIFVGGFVCCFQRDGKSLVAYSSVCHINFLVVVLLSYFVMGKLSSYLLILAHGVVASILFWFVGVIFHLSFSRRIYWLRGVLALRGGFSTLLFFILFFNFGVPFSISFFREYIFLFTIFSFCSVVGVLIFIYILLVCYFSLFLGISLVSGKSLRVGVIRGEILLIFWRVILCLNLLLVRMVF